MVFESSKGNKKMINIEKGHLTESLVKYKLIKMGYEVFTPSYTH